MSEALIKLILVLKITYPGGDLVCYPSTPVWCTYFVRDALAIDIIQDPWGGAEAVEWNPAEYIIE